MKARELIEKLSSFDPETEVHFAYDYGDYWKTVVAPSVKRVEEGSVKYSGYHRMDTLQEDEQSDRSVIILF